MVVLYAAYLLYSLTQPRAARPRGRRALERALCADHARVTAVVTGAMSELLVSAIEPTIDELGIGTVFVGMVIVPLVGNVPEHWAAVRIARGGNLDFAMSIAFNSGLQVALAGTAIAVAAGAVLGHEVLIVFPPIELALLGAATIMTVILASVGRANWLEGLQFLAIYVIAALAFWYL